jgi:adenosylcobinamide-phosphate synthase
MTHHIIAFVAGFLLDLLLGDPYQLPHPIRLIGSLIAKLEKILLGKIKERNEKKELQRGMVLVIIV